MVFKNPLNLARSGFAKTFAHYPQSLVAAAQSSSVSSNHPFSNFGTNVYGLFKPPQPSQPSQNAVHYPSSIQAGINVKSATNDASESDSGLAAYYAAWAKHHSKKEDAIERHQFQFAKRLGWKAPTTILEAPLRPADVSESKPARLPIKRSHTTSTVDDIKSAPREEVPAQHSAQTAQTGLSVHDTAALTASPERPSTAAPSETTQSSNLQPSPISSKPSSVSDADSFTDHLTTLAEAQRYAEVPAVFESMLRNGLKPSASAYNALLLAAISLSRGKHQVVPKALDVYSDMLRRSVAPDTSTYAILIELLSARALDVSVMKQELVGRSHRYGRGTHLLKSDEMEAKILAEDNSLALAVKLFDTSAAVSTEHVFTPETYRLLITACADAGRVEDMVRIYANMEGAAITPPSAIFSPMITAFAATGDLRSAVECYEEYKALAVAHDLGEKIIVRKDEDVYAAVVKAYNICGRTSGGLKFLGKIEDTFEGNDRLSAIRRAVAFQALYPEWLSQGLHEQSIIHAMEKLDESARTQALAFICVDAADKTATESAKLAFFHLSNQAGEISPSVSAAMLALFVRIGDLRAAEQFLQDFRGSQASVEMIEPVAMYAVASIDAGLHVQGLRELRRTFSSIRKSLTSIDVLDRMEETIELICSRVFANAAVPASAASIEALRLMMENGTLISAIAEPLLAGFGPMEVSQLSNTDLSLLIQVQASVLASLPALDVAHVSRFGHLLEISLPQRDALDKATAALIEQALLKVDQPLLSARWHQTQQTSSTALPSPQAPVFKDAWDPYLSSTDFKGSAAIAEELEKTNGKSIVHLNEALSKFRNMRRAGRHPRYATYAKLITAAAKENRTSLMHDMLAMAKQDIPFVTGSSVVRHGWVTIMDSMIAACLTVGDRQAATQFHRELLGMGAAPSANTFGLYITTLKESTKTFDEATEAVKIFHQAKTEGVEPSSFLYNALIGKLGKARRIDDCLFYFTEMRNLGIRPTSVTYGTIVNALCRVSDDRMAEELFEEMESMPNYKPRPAPYNSLMQYFLTTKRDRSKVLAYYERMKANNIKPTMHTYKLLIDSYATLEPVNMEAAEQLLAEIPSALGAEPEAVHFAALIHAKGCVLHDTAGARKMFDSVISNERVRPQPCLYQALFESMVANHEVAATDSLLKQMAEQGVSMTPYIANILIHGWAVAGDIKRAKQIFEELGKEKREPSTYEAMTRAWLAAGEHGQAMRVVGEMLKRGYPSAVAGKITELVQPSGT